MNPILLILTLAALVVGAYADEAKPPQKPETHAYSFGQIHLRRSDAGGHFFIAGKLDGQEVQFLIDTGAGKPLIVSKSMAEKLGKTLVEEGKATGMNGKTKTYGATFESLQLDRQLLVKNPSVRVLDLSHIGKLSLNGKPQTVDGLVGSAFLKSIRAVFDYGTPSLLTPLQDVPQGAYLRSRQQAGDPDIALKEGKDGYPFVTVRLKDKEFSFLIDTGATTNVMEPEIAKELGLEIEKTDEKVYGAGGGKAPKLARTKVEHPRLGRLELPQLQFAVVATQAGHTAPAGTRFGGIIGSQILTNMKASLDFDSYHLVVPRSLMKDPGSR